MKKTFMAFVACASVATNAFSIEITCTANQAVGWQNVDSASPSIFNQTYRIVAAFDQKKKTWVVDSPQFGSAFCFDSVLGNGGKPNEKSTFLRCEGLGHIVWISRKENRFSVAQLPQYYGKNQYVSDGSPMLALGACNEL